jgi:hypothetical protein
MGIEPNNRSSVLFGSLFESSRFCSVRFDISRYEVRVGSVRWFSVGIEFEFCSVRFVKLNINISSKVCFVGYADFVNLYASVA